MNTAPVLPDRLHAAVGHWLSFPNIVMLTTRMKTVGGQETAQQAITVGVKEKKTPAALTSRDFPVPPTVSVDVMHPDGPVRTEVIPTDVIQTGDFVSKSLSTRERPCPGGYQIASWQGWGWFGGRQNAGTLGVTTQWLGKRCLLTNCHVAGDRTSGPGLQIYQPAWSMLGSLWQEDGFLGRCDGTFDIMTCGSGTEANPRVNKYDFAWCEVDADHTASEIAGNVYDGTDLLEIRRDVHRYEPVRWIGQATGRVQTSTVKEVYYRYKKPSSVAGWEYWMDCIVLTTYPGGPALLEGDSGSALIADDDHRVIGLLTAQSEDGKEILATRIPEEKVAPDGPDGQIMRTLQTGP